MDVGERRVTIAGEASISASQAILQSMDETPAEVADSCFSRICCGYHFGQIMEGTAFVICAFAFIFFLYMFIGSAFNSESKVKFAVYVLDALVIAGTARWGYVEGQLIQRDNLDREIVQLGGQVERLSREVDRLAPLKEEYERLNVENKAHLERMGAENLRLSSSNGEYEKLIETQRSENERLMKSNSTYEQLNTTLSESVSKYTAFFTRMDGIATSFQNSNEGLRLREEELHKSEDHLENLAVLFQKIQDKMVGIFQQWEEQLAAEKQISGELGTKVVDLGHVKENLQLMLLKFADEQSVQAAIQKAEGDLLDRQKTLEEKLEMITRAQEELQTKQIDIQAKEEKMLERAIAMEEERAHLQAQLEAQTTEQGRITNALKEQLAQEKDNLEKACAIFRVRRLYYLGKIRNSADPERAQSLYNVTQLALNSPQTRPQALGVHRRARTTAESHWYPSTPPSDGETTTV